MFEAFILGIIQGITEFIPVSSSGHLVIAPRLFDMQEHSTAFDVMLHGGTLLALLIYYRKFLFNLALKIFSQKDQRVFAIKILIASIPTGIIGFLFEDKIDNLFKGNSIVSVMLISIGIIMIVTDIIYKKKPRNTNSKDEDITYKQALKVGILQPLSLIRGTSRSGITILAGLSEGMDLKQATNFSFLAGIPLIGGAVLAQLLEILTGANVSESIGELTVGFLAAFVSGLIAIEFMLTQINRLGLKWFGIYRIILGIIVIIVLL